MNNDKILEKAQNQDQRKLGEYEDHIYKTATRFSFFFMSILSFGLMIMKIIFNQSYFDVLCVASIGISIPNLYIGYNLKNKQNIYSGVIWLLMFIFSSVFYIQSLLG